MTEPEIIYDVVVEFLGKNDKNKSGASDKFYRIEITADDSRSFKRYIETRHWGKYGAKGSTKVIEHWYADGARRSADAKIQKQRDKGYTDPINALIRLATIMEG